jgi:hypothetical protein
VFASAVSELSVDLETPGVFTTAVGLHWRHKLLEPDYKLVCTGTTGQL